MGVINCKQPCAVLGVAGDRLSIADTGRSLPSIFWGSANVPVHQKCLPVEGIHPVGNCPAVGRTLDGATVAARDPISLPLGERWRHGLQYCP